MTKLSGAAMASAMAMMLGACATTTPAPLKAEKAAPAFAKCGGINECKGQGACNGADNACKSQNACKGQGWVETKDAAECTAKGGKVLG